MDYIIIMPAFNEEENIADTLNALIQQTLLPKRLIVVNDGSSDATPQIVETYRREYPWMELVNNNIKAAYAPGGKVVKAFYHGFNTIDVPYDVVVKLDADLILPPHYFERVMDMFQNDDQLGIAGGINVVKRNGDWVYENFSDKDHVKGAYKAYRKSCFEAIGGLRPSLGWDTADELIAMYHGWKVKTDPSLTIKHVRARGTSSGFIKIMKKIGYSMYRLRYGLFITMISAMKAGLVNRPFIISGFTVLYGWFEALLRRDDFIVNKEEGKFIRQFRRRRMFGKLLGRKRNKTQ